MLTVTENALAAIRQVVADQAEGLRLIVVSGGCAGLQYRMGLEDEAEDDDRVLEFESLRLFIDNESAILLQGATLDFIETEEGAGFVFDNPNAQGRCSCAKS